MNGAKKSGTTTDEEKLAELKKIIAREKEDAG